MIFFEKDHNRNEYAKSSSRQDSGTRGTRGAENIDLGARYYERKGKLGAEKDHAERDLADHFSEGGLRMKNGAENIKIKRTVRRNINEHLEKSVRQWETLWGNSDLQEIFHQLFSEVRQRDGEIDIWARYSSKDSSGLMRVRPSEMKRYQELLQQYPQESDFDESEIIRLSHSGARIFLGELSGGSGIPLSPKERSFIAKKVREEFQQRSRGVEASTKQREDDLLEEDDSYVDDDVSFSAEEIEMINEAPLTKDQEEEVGDLKKQKYFGQNR